MNAFSILFIFFSNISINEYIIYLMNEIKYCPLIVRQCILFRWLFSFYYSIVIVMFAWHLQKGRVENWQQKKTISTRIFIEEILYKIRIGNFIDDQILNLTLFIVYFLWAPFTATQLFVCVFVLLVYMMDSFLVFFSICLFSL